MLPDDISRLIYYILLLVFLGGALLFQISGRGSKAFRDILLWVIIFAGTAFGAGLWLGPENPTQRLTEAGRIEIPAGRDGHFHMTAILNGAEIGFIVDTGASTIALGPEDARRIGLDPDKLAYTGSAYTANGEIRTANVRIREFVIGDIVENDVPATVVDGDLDGSLLGMSYLRRFARVSFENDMMVLER